MHNLNEDFAKLLPDGDPFAILQAMEGKVYREVKGRKTLQFSLGGKSYFVKNHLGVGWAEILKNLIQLRMPILGAQNEWQAIKKLESIGLTTMTTVAYGSRGLNPASRQSFIVTEDLSNTISLEDSCREWRHSPPQFSLKQKLLSKIAECSRILHRGGVCHRDYYLCHFLMPIESSNVNSDQEFKLYIIDLHRALIKTSLARRWIIKDIAGLFYSAMDIGLTQRDYYRFIKLYDGMSLREALTKNAVFWSSVNKRAREMHKKLGSVK
tara:strand:- start:839 stop:1639 length:801 start_codon:yes stop_codon:yes gene_type:complete